MSKATVTEARRRYCDPAPSLAMTAEAEFQEVAWAALFAARRALGVAEEANMPMLPQSPNMVTETEPVAATLDGSTPLTAGASCVTAREKDPWRDAAWTVLAIGPPGATPAGRFPVTAVSLTHSAAEAAVAESRDEWEGLDAFPKEPPRIVTLAAPVTAALTRTAEETASALVLKKKRFPLASEDHVPTDTSAEVIAMASCEPEEPEVVRLQATLTATLESLVQTCLSA